MEQSWFEMHDIRRRWLSGTVWVPLHAVNVIDEVGERGFLGFKQEFLGLGSLAVAVELKDSTEELGWDDVGTSRMFGSYVDSGRYYPCDVSEYSHVGVEGISLVIIQDFNSQDVSEWHLHQDFVVALGLKREGDIWVIPKEGYAEAARLKRRSDSSPCLLEVKAEYLKDYLCARNMALFVASYRNREVVSDDISHITWRENPTVETTVNGRWEGRIYDIHEGGFRYGEEMAVIHASRTDVEPDDDIPVLGLPTDDNVESSFGKKKFEGRKLHVIQGELWRKEWIDPGDNSPRIRGDKLSSTVSFITDEAGGKETKETLRGGGKWLWFKPDVIMVLAHRRGGGLRWYTRYTGEVECSPDWSVRFGINDLGLVVAYAKDIAFLPDWQQQIWAAYNVGPEGGISEELHASQVKAMPAPTEAPEAFLPEAIELLNALSRDKFGFELFRSHEKFSEILRDSHRFRSINEPGFYSLSKDLARLTAESIDTKALHKIVQPSKGEGTRSLKSLERVLATLIPAEDARIVLTPLVGIYELRHGDSHLPGSDIDEAFEMVGVDRGANIVERGYQLMHSCVAALYNIAEILKDSLSEDHAPS